VNMSMNLDDLDLTADAAPVIRAASAKQMAFATDLVGRIQQHGGYAEGMAEAVLATLGAQESGRIVRKSIDGLIALSNDLAAKAEATLPEGRHESADGTVRVVKRSAAGHLYALDGEGEYLGKRGLAGLSAATLAAAPTEQAPPEVAQGVAAGRYAVADDDGALKFYVVDCPTEGRWAGYTFVKVQASDDLYPVRNDLQRARIIAAIAIDPQAAGRLYGQHIGKCCRCGRTLTDEASRAAGIGPVCEGLD
jgi:hypothetical protein